jgi:hypothetical protein
MIEQQLDVACRAAQLRRRERVDALLQCRPRDRERVDRIALATLAQGAPAAGHQLRRHPHDALAASQQEPLQLARHVPAILDRPDPLSVQAARPAQRALHPRDRRLHGLAATQLARSGVRRRQRVVGLVWIRPDHDHPPPSLRFR